MNDLEEIYKRYFQDVYKYLLALSKNEHIAEEITQETFFKALAHIDKFSGSSSVYSWLCQIAKNTYFSSYKKEKQFDHGINHHKITDTNSPDSLFITQEDAFMVHLALHKLQEPYKEVFSLRVFGELPFAQIARLFGKTESWARVTYHRAKIKIKEELS